MLGQVVSRGWVVALLCLSSLGLPSRATAVQMPDPDLLMSETGLMLLEIDDVPGTMMRAKKFYDGVYKEYRERGVLGPLQTPMTQFVFQQAKGDQPKHWLIKAVDSIATEGTELEDVWRPIAEKLAKDPTQVTPEDEDEVIAAFARLFKGKMFIGEEDHNPNRTTIFGFEYDPEVFDWMKELRLVAERQRERYGYEDRSETVSGVEVLHLPNEGWFAFAINDVLYGVAERKLEKTRVYVERILDLSQSESPSWSPLRRSRRYRRANRNEIEAPLRGHDAYLYLDIQGVCRRMAIGTSYLPLRFQQDDLRSLRFEDFACHNCWFKFDTIGNKLHYKIVYPLYMPHSRKTRVIATEYGGVGIPKMLSVPRLAKRILTVQMNSLRPTFPTLGYPSRIYLISTWPLDLAPDAKIEWDEAKQDFFSVIEGISSDKTDGFEIAYLAFGIEHADGLRELPGVMISRKQVRSAELLIRKLNSYMIEYRLSIEPLFKGRCFMDWGLDQSRDWGGLPDQVLFEVPERSDRSGELDTASPLRVLSIREVEDCVVFYIGTKDVTLVAIESDQFLYILPCLYKTEYGIAQLITEITTSQVSDVPVPTEFEQLFSPEDDIKQVLYQKHFNSREFGIDMVMAAIPDGLGSGDLSLLIEQEVEESFSFLHIVLRCFRNSLGQADEVVEREHLKFKRSLDPVDWFRDFLFRSDSMIQVGSMKLRERLVP
ncbi:MAG: hypothetical protein Q8M16_13400 [Pirellulaceae bacterium]|nr:hypothetical protein [Pirellulaceae bacterium]